VHWTTGGIYLQYADPPTQATCGTKVTRKNDEIILSIVLLSLSRKRSKSKMIDKSVIIDLRLSQAKKPRVLSIIDCDNRLISGSSCACDVDKESRKKKIAHR
jgi:hypothetical protein